MPVIFPDQAILLNTRGYHMARRPVAKYDPFLETPRTPAQDVQQSWRAEAAQRVMDGLHNNATKDRLLTGHLPSSITYNGRTPRGNLRGGTIKTPQGQRLLNNQLGQRITQLNTLAASAWGSPTQQLSSVLPPAPATMTAAMDNAFVALSDAVQTGSVDRSLLEGLNAANSALLNVGASLYPEQIAQYIRYNDQLQLSVEALLDNVISASTGAYALPTDKKKILTTLDSGLKRQRKVLEKLNDNVYASVADKKLLLNSSRSQLVTQAFGLLEQRGPLGVVSTATRPLPPTTQLLARRAASERSRAAQDYLTRIRDPRM
jgi:hypothetical protein